MNLTGTADEIMVTIARQYPGVRTDLARARAIVPNGKVQDTLWMYQASCLYALACGYDGKRILELGTYYGFTAAVMALAAPKASIISINPSLFEVEIARKNLEQFKNISVICRYSWDYLQMIDSEWMFDMIFVDGDHKRVREDFPWWNRLNPGGLFFFHDYSPNGSGRACPSVYRALESFKGWLGRKFDVMIVDDQQVGMAGYYKRAEDKVYLGECDNG